MAELRLQVEAVADICWVLSAALGTELSRHLPCFADGIAEYEKEAGEEWEYDEEKEYDDEEV